MKTQEVLDQKNWAEQTFGEVQLHNRRRTRRTIQAARRLTEHPQGSLPAQMHDWKGTKAMYRLVRIRALAMGSGDTSSFMDCKFDFAIGGALAVDGSPVLRMHMLSRS